MKNRHRLHTIPILIEYSAKDTRRGVEWLINDIAAEVTKRLSGKIRKQPEKITVVITYNSIYKDGSYDITGNRGQQRQQGKNRSNGVQDLRGRGKRNPKPAEGNSGTKRQTKRKKAWN